MPVPTWTVEIAFASTPLATAPTWVDVTAYVLDEAGIQIDRGRSSPLEDFRTGTARFRLNNTDRRFDPLYSSGPYFGNLLPGKQVRIRATANSVTTDQFRGFIKGWPQSFDSANLWAYVDVECYDGLGWLSEARASGDLVYDYANTTIGSLQLFLRNAEGPLLRDASGVTGDFRSDTLSAVGTLAPGMTSSAVTANVPNAVRSSTGGWLRSSGAWSVSLWVRLSGTPPLGWTISSYSTPSLDASISINSSMKLVVRSSGGTNSGEVVGGPRLDDGRPHCITISFAASLPSVYIDGVVVDMSHTVLLGAGFDGRFGISQVQPYVAAGDPGSPVIQDVAAWNVALSSSQATTLYQFQTANYRESATVRAGRILDAVGWPSAWRDLTAAPVSECTTPPYNSTQALNLLREVAATEQGRLYCDKSNNVTLLGRYHDTTVTRGSTIQSTFSDDGSDIAYSVTGYEHDVDDVLNDVTVSIRLTDASSNSTNSTSITNYGRKSDTINTLLPSSDLALNMAQGVVMQRKDVTTRISPVRPAIEQTAANWQAILAREIGDRVRLELTPSRIGSQFQQSAIIEGITIDAHLAYTDISFEAAPLPAVTWFTLDSSTLDGAHVVAF